MEYFLVEVRLARARWAVNIDDIGYGSVVWVCNAGPDCCICGLLI